MAKITTTVQHLVVSFQSLMDSGDPKTADWPFVSTPWPIISFLAIYLVIVKVGPTIMQKREACNLREVLIIYNFLLVILSVWLVYESVASAMDIPNFNFICPSLPYVIGDAKHNRLARAIYVYWLSKFVESLETVFFILRKKNNQVSFLHVYHHSVMVVLGWTASKWLPGGISKYFQAPLNCVLKCQFDTAISNFLRSGTQQLCARCDVCLLRSFGFWSSHASILVVETLHYQTSTDSICATLDLRYQCPTD
ncbi:very long chain fatty acid elongase 4-like isoform X4 [Montipora foliosa]|uniref:very long chain fatty acid elongase 4-like isoform X4 n=1 Tax=Montipora foliosa TaxID=591990 RepID=UPI0035F11181